MNQVRNQRPYSGEAHGVRVVAALRAPGGYLGGGGPKEGSV